MEKAHLIFIWLILIKALKIHILMAGDTFQVFVESNFLYSDLMGIFVNFPIKTGQLELLGISDSFPQIIGLRALRLKLCKIISSMDGVFSET